MITLLAWLLLIINLTILIVSLIVVFMNRRQTENSAVLTNAHIVSVPYGTDEWEEEIDLDNQRVRALDYIHLRCPEFQVMFEDISTDHACIFRFKGLSKRKECVVYVFRNEDAKDAFMSALDQFLENAKTPQFGIILVFPFTHTCNEEILIQLKAKNISIQMIMCDETGLQEFSTADRTCALVGVGKKPYAVYEVKNDNAEYDWLGELNSCELFSPVYSEEAHASVLSVSDILDTKEKFLIRFPSLFSNLIINTLTHRYPDTISWFYPIIDKQDKYLIIYAPSKDSLKEAMNKIETSAKNKNVSLTLVKKQIKKNELNPESKEYKKWLGIIRSDTATLVIPFLFEDHHDFACDCPIVSFAPLYQNKVTSSYEAVQYYISLLEFKTSF